MYVYFAVITGTKCLWLQMTCPANHIYKTKYQKFLTYTLITRSHLCTENMLTYNKIIIFDVL